MKALCLVALALGACVFPDRPDDHATLDFEVGTPLEVGYAPNVTGYDICVAVTGDGGSIHVAEPSEGTVTTPDVPILPAAPNATCPLMVGDVAATGWAVFHWQTAKGQATVAVRYTEGPLFEQREITLVGKPFAGYAVMLDGEVMASGMFQQFAFALTYADSNHTPAAHVPFTLTAVPDIMVEFPGEMAETDGAGKATIVVKAVEESTMVYVTPSQSTSLFLTTLEP